MELPEFQRRRLHYAEKSKIRDLERMNMGSGVDDTPWYVKVLEEMTMDFLERIERIEKLLEPAPKEETPKGKQAAPKEETPKGKKPKFF